MKILFRTVGVILVSVELLLTTGCVNPDGSQNNTGTGALIGGAFGALAGAAGGGRYAGQRALVGALAGALVGGLVGNMMDREQQERLRQQSPQTLQTIQHNDYVAQQQSAAAQPTAAPTSVQPAPEQNLNYTPITVEDIKALTDAGVKTDAINQEITTSQSKYSPQDIAAAQQANVDPAVIACMKNHAS